MEFPVTNAAISQWLKSGRPPCQSLQENAVAYAWLTAHATELEEVAFNVRLGRGADPGETYPEYFRRLVMLGTRKRADLVARIRGAAAIVEFKYHARPGVLQQLLEYSQLYTADHAGEPPPRLIVAAAIAAPGLRPHFLRAGVELELFGG